MKFWPLLLLFPLAGCRPAPSTAPTLTINGVAYQIVDAEDDSEYHDEPRQVMTAAPGVSREDTFAGHDRAAAKTTLVEASLHEFPSIAALEKTLPTDAEMQAKGLTKQSDRIKEEQRTVSAYCFVHAWKKEADNDYHLIIGDAHGPYFVAEISGIPVDGTAANRKQLTSVRELFKTTMHLKGGGPTPYRKPIPPIPATVTGSLFYDVDHKPGVVGPVGMKPATAWEIHPVGAVEFR